MIRAGIAGVVLLMVGFALSFSKLADYGGPVIGSVLVVSQWGGILLLVYAGIKGPRWWLAVPTLLIAVWIWALFQGH